MCHAVPCCDALAVLCTLVCWSRFRYLKVFVQDMLRTGRQLTASNGKPYDIILVDEAQVCEHTCADRCMCVCVCLLTGACVYVCGSGPGSQLRTRLC